MVEPPFFDWLRCRAEQNMPFGHESMRSGPGPVFDLCHVLNGRKGTPVP
jgi:hypothetical protein